MAQYRQQVSAGGSKEDDEGGYIEGLMLALKDPFSWMFAFLHFAIIIGQSYKDFFPSVSDDIRLFGHRDFANLTDVVS